MTEQNKPRAALIEAAQAGSLLSALGACDKSTREQRDELAMELAALHNEGQVDVVAAFTGLKSGPEFFANRHIFEKVLPDLDTPVGPVMHCVLHLYREAGDDMAAGMIFEPFVEFCSASTSRPSQALNEIEADPDSLVDLLPATIAAGSQLDNPHFLGETIRLIQAPNIEIRRRAVFCMGRLHWPEGAPIPDLALNALEQAAAAGTDDRLLGTSSRRPMRYTSRMRRTNLASLI